MLEMIELEQAQELILALTGRTSPEDVALLQSRGRVLAETVYGVLDVPPFDRSPLDGYAVRGEDTLAGLPAALRLMGEIPAGSSFPGTLEPGAAIRILTGSPMPAGANAVIRQEDTQEENGVVQIFRPVRPGANISRRGEDFRQGEELFAPGRVLTPAEIGILASQGIRRIKVFSRPRVALASTGDELKDVGLPLAPGQIYNSNFYTLAAMIEAWGGQTIPLGLVQDRVSDLAEVMREGLASADLVVTTGGASVGAYDVTARAMERAGVEVKFWRAAFKPGTPVICGYKGDKLVLGLSGNPAAAMISAALLLGPVVRKMAGFKAFYPKRVRATSKDEFAKSSGTRRFIRAKVVQEESGWSARFPSSQQPGILKSMLGTNALVDLAAGSTLQAGQACNAFLLEEWI